MSSYLDCENLAKRIFDEMQSKKIGSSDDSQNKFSIEIPDLEKVEIKSSALVLGLNPSDLGKRQSNFFWYIPQLDEIVDDYSKSLHERATNHTYPKYFKTYVELFQNLKPDKFNPIWYNEFFLQKIFSKNREKVDDDLKDHLKKYFCQNDNKRYLLFADLIQYTETDSKKIIEHFEEMKELVNNYIECLFDYLKPKVVLSANAFVSRYLVELFNAGKEATFIDINRTYKTRIFLSSMLTGQRAMDTFSRQRLFNEIQLFLLNEN